MAKALIVVDVQPTFCEGGELGVEGGNAVAGRIADYVNAHRGEYAYTATTQDWHIEPGAHWSGNPDFVDTWPKHGAAGTPNAELHPAIAALGIAHHFKKGQYSAAYSGFEGIEDNTDRIQTREEVTAEQSAGKTLANALKAAGVTQVDVVGIAESHCVKDTARCHRVRGSDRSGQRGVGCRGPQTDGRCRHHIGGGSLSFRRVASRYEREATRWGACQRQVGVVVSPDQSCGRVSLSADLTAHLVSAYCA